MSLLFCRSLFAFLQVLGTSWQIPRFTYNADRSFSKPHIDKWSLTSCSGNTLVQRCSIQGNLPSWKTIRESTSDISQSHRIDWCGGCLSAIALLTPGCGGPATDLLTRGYLHLTPSASGILTPACFIMPMAAQSHNGSCYEVRYLKKLDL